MHVSLHNVWGCAHGPVMALSPQIRMVAGAAVFAACMTSSAADPPGVVVGVAGAAAWVAACRPPIKVIMAALLLGMALFLPYLLLAPIAHLGRQDADWGWARSLAAPMSVVMHGICGMVVSIATVTCLTASDLHEGIVRLPIPRPVSAILVQIIHQTGTLWYETRRIAEAMAVRSATGGGRTALRLLSALPRIWLPRVMQRAEWVAAAMELRGHEGTVGAFRDAPVRVADLAALALVCGWLALAVALRIRGTP